jgi:hypothetical protein
MKKYFVILNLICSSALALPTVQKYRDRGLTEPMVPPSHFSPEHIQDKTFVEAKLTEWQGCHHTPMGPMSAANDSRRINLFLESPTVLQNLVEMEKLKLLSGKVEIQPWSGHFWPYAAGLIAARPFDPDFLKNFSWKARYDYAKENTLQSWLLADDSKDLNRLSPAEKYDLIFGDPNGTLTDTMWAQGKLYFDRFGKVEGWMGICHGWAPAAIMEARPKHSAEINYADQAKIHLKPAEVKAYLSYSWATNEYPAISLGERCYKKNPDRDENGRLIDPECQDMNPATWHIAMVNKVGLQKRSFVMDSTFDYEVWNQPISEYSYKYVHPITKAVSESAADSTLALSDYPNDPFAKYRGSNAHSIVGVRMKVAYISENGVPVAETDNENDDSIVWTSYEYDLELDNAGNIVGGEWISSNHPDFAWIPYQQAVPKTPWDAKVKNLAWDPNKKSTEELNLWVQAATRSSRVLHPLVEKILELSIAE